MDTLPDEIITLISKFLSTNDKEACRRVNKNFYNNVRLIDIKVDKLNTKYDDIMNGSVYILNRLRLAALSGLSSEIVAYIWSWVYNQNSNKIIRTDSLPILRYLKS